MFCLNGAMVIEQDRVVSMLLGCNGATELLSEFSGLESLVYGP